MAGKKDEDTASRGSVKAIDVIKQCYMGERKCISVPEWHHENGDPLDLWFGPITPSDMEKVDDRKPKNHLERQLILMVDKAEDEGGKPLFSRGDIKHLKDNTEFTVLQRVFDFMLSSLMDKMDAADRIREDPTSGGASPSQKD